ncbi:hypothetical protein D9757_009703 [Collybiopsis confluens]|uniref:Hydrophobin n=1 Tax=Collybiopsis confluens TaxID=2823264 RepID=A0A8H5H5X8_9AGAR|nr:hypothetical protein D9757_009703 [Collybiopsis confluens]
MYSLKSIVVAALIFGASVLAEPIARTVYHSSHQSPKPSQISSSPPSHVLIPVPGVHVSMNVELGLKHNETPGAQFQAVRRCFTMYSLKSIVVAALIFGASVLAEPIARTVYHCNTPENPSCPPGYRCCKAMDPTLGGTCALGEIGSCPLSL